MQILRKVTYQFLFVVLLVCSTIILSAQKPPVQGYQIKAVFLLNFSRFVEWPASAFPSDKAPIIIGILGEDPFGSYLDEVLAGEEVNGRSVIVKRFEDVDDIEVCHILYIKMKESEGMEKIIEPLKEKNTLTISDSDDFIKNGGMIRFVKVSKRIQFQINPEAAKAADIKISSKLLSLAEIVAFNEKE